VQVVQVSPYAASHLPLPQHWPQSFGHEAQVSPSTGWQRPLPQLGGQGPQSCVQVVQLSPNTASHLPLPQHWPQSFGHEAQVSLGSHLLFPHSGGQGPQSCAHVAQVSVGGSHMKLPHWGGQVPQSWGQVSQLSPASHFALPHLGGHRPQSCGQLVHVSAGPTHMPSPHCGGQVPQSCAQVLQSSPISHCWLPQVGRPQPPHWFLHSSTQMPSHAVLQQYGSIAQTHASHLHFGQLGVDFSWQPSQVPQSLAHEPQSSSGFWHFPSPHVGHGPQSFGQLVQVSLNGSHMPSPHSGQGPQSFGQLVQVSISQLSHWPLPQQLPQSFAQV
jgi:hypothetical protein